MNTLNSQLQATTTDVAMSQASSLAQVDRINKVDITAVIAGNNPSNKTLTNTDVSAVNDTLSVAAGHGLTTGVKFTLTSTGTLPAGLAAATNYYAVVTSTTLTKVATSQANALANTVIDITSAGTAAATITIIPNTTLAGTIKLQKNNNPPQITAVWVDCLDGEMQGSSTASKTISAAATVNWSVPVVTARELRLLTTITSGTVTVDARAHGKQ